MEWIELDNKAGGMPDLDCWVSDGMNVFYSEQGQYIPIGLYSHYMVAEKPLPPIKESSLPDLLMDMGITENPMRELFKGLDITPNK